MLNSNESTKSGNEENTNIDNTGTIYRVPGEETESGKPYIGCHNKEKPQGTRKSNDGRNRKKSEVIDRYDPKNTEEGQYKEQKAMDKEGGLDKLDNKRREVRKDRMKELEEKYKNDK